jgi:hypothetical protein
MFEPPPPLPDPSRPDLSKVQSGPPARPNPVHFRGQQPNLSRPLSRVSGLSWAASCPPPGRRPSRTRRRFPGFPPQPSPRERRRFLVIPREHQGQPYRRPRLRPDPAQRLPQWQGQKPHGYQPAPLHRRQGVRRDPPRTGLEDVGPPRMPNAIRTPPHRDPPTESAKPMPGISEPNRQTEPPALSCPVSRVSRFHVPPPCPMSRPMLGGTPLRCHAGPLPWTARKPPARIAFCACLSCRVSSVCWDVPCLA